MKAFKAVPFCVIVTKKIVQIDISQFCSRLETVYCFYVGLEEANN